ALSSIMNPIPLLMNTEMDSMAPSLFNRSSFSDLH
ncbi:hypothetical protein CCACVL1_05233, partial [Corchorus capsularis]